MCIDGGHDKEAGDELVGEEDDGSDPIPCGVYNNCSDCNGVSILTSSRSKTAQLVGAWLVGLIVGNKTDTLGDGKRASANSNTGVADVSLGSSLSSLRGCAARLCHS